MDATQKERYYNEPMQWLVYAVIAMGAVLLLALAGFAIFMFWISRHDGQVRQEIEMIRDHKPAE